MTVTSDTSRKSFSGDGATTSFGTLPMVFFDSADLIVSVTVTSTGVTTTLTEDTHYTVSGGSGATGTVNLAGGSSPWGAVASGSTLAIVRDVAITQESDFENNDTSDAEVVEDALDRLTMIAQQHGSRLDRALRQPDGDVTDLDDLPGVLERASKYLAFDSSGQPTVVDAATASGTTVTATGSTSARLLAERFSDVINVKDFGATGDGSTDDTAAIQAAVSGVQGTDCSLYFPPGTYKVTSTINVGGAVRIFGAGRYASIISWTNTTLNVFAVNSNFEVAFESMHFSGPASATAGAMIHLTGPSGAGNSFSIIRDCTFALGWNCIDTTAAYAWTVDNCYFTGFENFGIRVRNTGNVDAGDSKIINNTFANAGASSVAVQQESSGGLRIIDNKFNGNGIYGYRMVLASGAVTSDLIIANNSFENYTTAAMKFYTSGGGALYYNVQINSNQIALVPIGIDMDSATQYMGNITICDNLIALNASGTSGITITNQTDFIVQGNVITGSGGTPSGITTGASCLRGHVGENEFKSLTTWVAVDTTSVTVTKAAAKTIRTLSPSVSAPADTSENTLATITIPANMIGISGYIRVRATFTCTSSANNKTFRIRYSGGAGTVVWTSGAQTTITTLVVDAVIQAGGATNAQLTNAMAITSSAALVAANVSSAVDTTAVTTVVLTGEKASAGETLTLVNYIVDVCNG